MATKCIRFILACCSMIFSPGTFNSRQKEKRRVTKQRKAAATANTDAASEPALTDKFKALEFRESAPPSWVAGLTIFAAVERQCKHCLCGRRVRWRLENEQQRHYLGIGFLTKKVCRRSEILRLRLLIRR